MIKPIVFIFYPFLFPSDFFQHFGNGTSTGSIGKNSLILPSMGKSATFIFEMVKYHDKCYSDLFSKSKQHMTGMHENCFIPCQKYQIN